ncbi:MAG: hypothetical protein WD048_02940 [Chitinophagales bacterium]
MLRFLTLLLLISFFNYEKVLAQLPIEIDEKVMPMSRGKQPGLEFMIHEANVKEVQKNWESKMRSANRPSMNTERDEIQAMNATVESISNQPVNVFAKFTQLKEGVYGQLFFQFEDDFLSRSGNALILESAKKYAYDFAMQEYKYALEEEFDEAESKYKDLEKDKKKLVKTNDDIHKTISESEREISQVKNDVKINEADQNRLVSQIGNQKEIILDIPSNNPDALKAAEKELSNLENDYKKLQKEHEKLHKSIDEAEADIREAERQLKLNKADMDRKQDELLQQKAVLEVLKEKIDNLK